MKKLAFLLAMVLGATNMYAQDYDLQRLAKICKEHKILSYSEGLICYFDLLNEVHVFVNTMGEKVIEMHYVSSDYPYFSDGLIVVGGGDNEVTMGNYGYADKSGKIVIPYKYDAEEPFYKGIAKVSKDGRQFYIDKKGKECFDKDKQSEYVEAFDRSFLSKEINESGLIKVENNGKYGWKNEKGDIVIPIQYEMATDIGDGLAMDFDEGLAMVKLNDVVGFVDKYGNSTFNPPTTINTLQNTEKKTFDVTETLPSFKGGQEALNRWISENMQYPQDAYNDGIQGRVKVSVEINSDGSIGDVSIVKSVHPSLDKEAIRLFKSMPKWNPGTQNGNPVSAKMEFPLTFRLE